VLHNREQHVLLIVSVPATRIENPERVTMVQRAGGNPNMHIPTTASVPTSAVNTGFASSQPVIVAGTRDSSTVAIGL